MHKIGLIGYGTIASGYHNTTFQRDDIDFELTAVFDLRESQRTLAAQQGFKVFDNLRDFLDSRLFEMVTIAVPNNNHCPLAIACLEAGYHVMVEKPCALTCAEIEKIMATAKRCGKLFTVHHNRRWDRDFLIVRQAIETGLLGNLHTIESRIHPRVKEGGGLPGWRGLPDHGGGMLLDWGIHMLDQMLYLIQEPIVSVTANIAHHNGNPVDDWSRIIIRFENGPVATVETATFTPLWLPRWYVVGDQGALSMDFIGDTKCRIRRIAESHPIEGFATAYTLTGTEQRPVTGRCIDRFEEFDYPREGDCQPPQDWASLYKNLAGVLDGTQELIVKPEQVLRVFRVVEAAFKSDQTGQSVLF